MKLWHDNTGARLGNNVVLRLSDARLRASKVEPVGGFDLNGLDLVLTLPLIDSPTTTITFSSDGMSLDEVVDEINAIIGPAGTDVGLARSADGALEILAKRAEGQNYSFLSIAINSSPATAVLGFYPRAVWVDAGVLSTSGDLESSPFGGRSNRNPDDATFIGPESLNEGGVNRALVSLGLSNDALMSMLTTPRPILQRGGSPLGTGSRDIKLSSGLCGTKIFVGFSSSDVSKYFQIRDADGLPIFDAQVDPYEEGGTADPITVQYVTTGQCVGNPPVDAEEFGDGGNILEGGIRLLIPMDGNDQNTITEVRGKCQLVCAGVDFGSGESVYSDLLARVESSLAEPNNNGYWRIAGLYRDMIEVRLPAALPEDPYLTLKPWLTTDATSHGTVAVYTDGNFFPTRLVTDGEAYIHLSAPIPEGVVAYLYYFGPQSYLEATFGGDLSDSVERLLDTDLSAILQTIRRMKGTGSGLVGPNDALVVDPWGDPHPVSLEDLHATRGLNGAYAGQSRNGQEPAGNYISVDGDGVQIEAKSYTSSGLTKVLGPYTDGETYTSHGRSYLSSASAPFTTGHVGDMIKINEAGAFGQNVCCKIIRFVSSSQVELGPDIVGSLTDEESASNLTFNIYRGDLYHPLSGGGGLVIQSRKQADGFVALQLCNDGETSTPRAHLRLLDDLGGVSYLEYNVHLDSGNEIHFQAPGIHILQDARVQDPSSGGMSDFIYIQGSNHADADGWYRVIELASDTIHVAKLTGSSPAWADEEDNSGIRAFYFCSELLEYHDPAATTGDLFPDQSSLRARSFQAQPGRTGFSFEAVGSSYGGLLVRDARAGSSALGVTASGDELDGVFPAPFSLVLLREADGWEAADAGVYLARDSIYHQGVGYNLQLVNLDGSAPSFTTAGAHTVYTFRAESLLGLGILALRLRTGLPAVSVGIQKSDFSAEEESPVVQFSLNMVSYYRHLLDILYRYATDDLKVDLRGDIHATGDFIWSQTSQQPIKLKEEMTNWRTVRKNLPASAAHPDQIQYTLDTKDLYIPNWYLLYITPDRMSLDIGNGGLGKLFYALDIPTGAILKDIHHLALNSQDGTGDETCTTQVYLTRRYLQEEDYPGSGEKWFSFDEHTDPEFLNDFYFKTEDPGGTEELQQVGIMDLFLEGGLLYDGMAYLDSLDCTKDTATDDVDLLGMHAPVVPVLGNARYYGYSKPFDTLLVDLTTVGDGVWQVVWEYWDGDSWEDLDASDPSGAWLLGDPGWKTVDWDLPGDWATSTIDGHGPLYWVRERVTLLDHCDTAPLGRMVKVRFGSSRTGDPHFAPPKEISSITDIGGDQYEIRLTIDSDLSTLWKHLFVGADYVYTTGLEDEEHWPDYQEYLIEDLVWENTGTVAVITVTNPNGVGIVNASNLSRAGVWGKGRDHVALQLVVEITGAVNMDAVSSKGISYGIKGRGPTLG